MSNACLRTVVLLSCVLVAAFATGEDNTEKTAAEKPDSLQLDTREFRCLIGNNAADTSGHMAGFNGIWSLKPKSTANDFIAKGLAGLNLEHYFNGLNEDIKQPELLFDPRYSPIEFRCESASGCSLHQPPTKHFGVESWTEFTVSEPCYVDMSFRCIPRKDVFPSGWLGVFWATYVPKPDDTSIYFLAYETPAQTKPTWFKSAGEMYYGRNAEVPLRFAGPMKSHAMATASTVRWAEPFYYGVWGDRAYLIMFDTEHDLAMYAGQSPSGWNPWDFQMIIRSPRIDSEYRLRVRVAFHEFKGSDWALNEYTNWRAQSARLHTR